MLGSNPARDSRLRRHIMPKGQDYLLQVILPLLVYMLPAYALKTHKIRRNDSDLFHPI
jgi:hypothetical protein